MLKQFFLQDILAAQPEKFKLLTEDENLPGSKRNAGRLVDAKQIL